VDTVDACEGGPSDEHNEAAMDREVKARQVYEKLANWKDAEGLAVDDVLKSGTRVEIVKRRQGAGLLP
jgi:hypothetical protein